MKQYLIVTMKPKRREPDNNNTVIEIWNLKVFVDVYIKLDIKEVGFAEIS